MVSVAGGLEAGTACVTTDAGGAAPPVAGALDAGAVALDAAAAGGVCTAGLVDAAAGEVVEGCGDADEVVIGQIVV